ncbi:beta strand repeat-containing protein, partial [Falsiroseomonas stagni]
RVTDAAGNSGSASSLSYVLDVTAPTTTLSGLAISTDTGSLASDRLTKAASQTVTATLSSALASGEVLQGSVDGGVNWSDITSSASGTAVTWTSANLAVGSNSISLRVTDAAGNSGSASSLSYELDVTAPTTTLSGLAISTDTGTSTSDRLTKVASQTVTATLSSALASGDVLEGSVDGGATWSNITSAANGTAVSWTGANLAVGSSSIRLRVTDEAGNSGSAGILSYELDVTAPTTTLSGLAIAPDTGTSASDRLTKAASQTVTATLSSALASGEVLQGSVDGGTTWSNITSAASGTAVSWTGANLAVGSNSISLRVTDAAGNSGSASSLSYELDVTAPTTTLSGLAIGTDTGTSTSDRLTKAASQTVTATLSSALASGEVLEGSVDGGANWSNITSAASGTAVSWTSANLAVGSNSISLRVTDAAGNSGSASSLSYVLDVTAPTTTLSGFDISADTGTSAGDFITKVASQTVTATLSSALSTGDVLQGSVDNGANWSDITAAASGTAVSWTGATLAGNSSIQIRVTDAAGNSGAAFGQAYSLDTTAPSRTILGVDFSSDTGIDGDFVTTTRVQTISATLSGSLGSGDLLMGSLDGGSTWTDVTSFISGSSFSWSGVSLNQGTNQLRLQLTDVAGNNGDVAIRAYELGGQIAVSRGGSAATSEASFNTDPNVDIRFAWLGSSGNEAVAGTDSNDFLALLGGDDAANGGAGNDVLDGGTGSNFLIGGAGVDRFFVDARGGQVTWSTIGDFDLAAGEEVSLWGWRAGVSRVTWVENDGAVGWKGVTMQADIDGNGVNDTYITWTGLEFDDLPVPLATQTGDGTQLLWFF